MNNNDRMIFQIELTGELVENRELLNRYKAYSNEISANQSKLEKLNRAAQQLVGSCGSANGDVSMQVTRNLTLSPNSIS